MTEVSDSAVLELCYGTLAVENGMNLVTVDDALAEEPQVAIKAPGGGTYSLLLVDADAPSPHAPKQRCWLSWLVCNIPQHDVRPPPTPMLAMWPPSCCPLWATSPPPPPANRCMQVARGEVAVPYLPPEPAKAS